MNYITQALQKLTWPENLIQPDFIWARFGSGIFQFDYCMRQIFDPNFKQAR